MAACTGGRGRLARALAICAGLVAVEDADRASAADGGRPGGATAADGGGPGGGHAQQRWVPFSIGGIDAPTGAVDLSALNDAPAGARGFVRARGGHFVDGGGARLRLFGVNLTGAPCFPDRATAPKVARHLRRLGVNVVRFHYIDHAPAPTGLLAAEGSEALDPAQLERLDFFVAALAAEGIYTNLNLHVARQYPGMTEEARRRFPQGKVLGRFYPPFLESQRRFARALLLHRNPHTGRTYAEEPAVIAVELNNEDTLHPFWGGNADDLPDPYGAELRRSWNVWLRARYGTMARLRAAWAAGARLGPELLRNADLREGTAGWTFETAGVPTTGAVVREGGRRILRFQAPAAAPEAWQLQLFQGDLPLEEGKTYTLSFRARAVAPAAPRTIDVSAMLGVPDWRNLGLTRAVELGPAWARHEISFRPGKTVADKARLVFQLRNVPGTIDFADVSLREGAPPHVFPPGERLERGTVASASSSAPGPRGADWSRFLADTERATATALATYVRRDLGVKALVVDSQANYGGVPGLAREIGVSDFVDMHGYWQHPAMPEGWASASWTIENRSQTGARDGGTLGFIATNRVAGRPFTVSEYNTPSPSDHAAETLPLYAALAGFQDWDGIYLYTWLDFRTDWNADRLLGFFDYAGHPGKLVFAPIAALAFRAGLVTPGREALALALPPEAPAGSDLRAIAASWRAAGGGPALVATRRLEVTPVEGAGAPSLRGAAPAPGPSDTGELAWTPEAPRPRFLVNAPAFRAAIGAIAGEAIPLGDVALQVGPLERGHATVALVALDRRPIAASSRLLVAAAARVENTGMRWNAARSSVGRDWGGAPTLAERVPITLTLPGRGWRGRALDGAGRPTTTLAAEARGEATRIAIPRPDTIWWLFERAPAPPR